jgi:hypothetical protein
MAVCHHVHLLTRAKRVRPRGTASPSYPMSAQTPRCNPRSRPHLLLVERGHQGKQTAIATQLKWHVWKPLLRRGTGAASPRRSMKGLNQIEGTLASISLTHHLLDCNGLDFDDTLCSRVAHHNHTRRWHHRSSTQRGPIYNFSIFVGEPHAAISLRPSRAAVTSTTVVVESAWNAIPAYHLVLARMKAELLNIGVGGAGRLLGTICGCI